jgi:branched-chain amino acid transport system ATP-binding protein
MAETDKPIAVVRELNRQGVTIVMVEHVMPVIMQLATRMVVINFGEKIAEGSPGEIVKDQRVIDAYFGEHLDA